MNFSNLTFQGRDFPQGCIIYLPMNLSNVEIAMNISFFHFAIFPLFHMKEIIRSGPMGGVLHFFIATMTRYWHVAMFVHLCRFQHFCSHISEVGQVTYPVTGFP